VYNAVGYRPTADMLEKIYRGRFVTVGPQVLAMHQLSDSPQGLAVTGLVRVTPRKKGADERHLVAGTVDGRPFLWDPVTGAPVDPAALGPAVSFLPTGAEAGLRTSLPNPPEDHWRAWPDVRTALESATSAMSEELRIRFAPTVVDPVTGTGRVARPERGGAVMEPIRERSFTYRAGDHLEILFEPVRVNGGWAFRTLVLRGSSLLRPGTGAQFATRKAAYGYLHEVARSTGAQGVAWSGRFDGWDELSTRSLSRQPISRE
jgi:hypothetical protein